MGNLTHGYENKILDGLTGVAPLTTPTTTYLALFSADPTNTGDVANELPTGTGYGRIATTGKFPSATGIVGTVANDVQIDWAIATGNWTTATHIGLMEGGTVGVADMMEVIALNSPVTIASGQTFTLYAGKLVLKSI